MIYVYLRIFIVSVALIFVPATAHVSPDPNYIKMMTPGGPNDIKDNIASPTKFPCNLEKDGMKTLTGTAPVNEWQAGKRVTFRFYADGALHNAGSCELSLSKEGEVWRVFQQYVGGCPAMNKDVSTVCPVAKLIS